jgi:hypothetical protein
MKYYLSFILNILINVNSIPYDVYYTNKLNNETSDPLNNTCFCDITGKSCDVFCCCDPDCDNVIII